MRRTRCPRRANLPSALDDFSTVAPYLAVEARTGKQAPTRTTRSSRGLRYATRIYPSSPSLQVSKRVRLTWSDTVVIMEYDPLAPVPRYRQIAGIIRERIERGEILPQRPVPSEVQIEQEFGVARATARKAIAVLRDAGLVVTVPGLGTFVLPPGERKPPADG
jgi:GntR family transcriptional regulator